jgi:hypothetical protein
MLGDENLRRRISPKSARTLALCGDHSNYTFERAGYDAAISGVHNISSATDVKTIYYQYIRIIIQLNQKIKHLCFYLTLESVSWDFVDFVKIDEQSYRVFQVVMTFF